MQISSIRPGPSANPSWSPNGKQIAFSALTQFSTQDNSENYWQIYIADVEQTKIKQLTNVAANNQAPEWSPDGKYIAFISDRDGFSEVYVMNVDGSEANRVTYNEAIADSKYNTTLTWSPDSQYIAYISSKDKDSNTLGNYIDIYAINVQQALHKKTQPVDLSIGVTDCNNYYDIDWSPDGAWLAFTASCSKDNKTSNIYLLKIDGELQYSKPSYPIRLTTGYNDWFSVDWLSDSNHLLSNTIISKIYNIFIIDIKSTLQQQKLESTQITRNTDENIYFFDPVWKP